MSADRVQFPTLPKSTQDIAILNLAWQSMADSIAGRAPIAAIMPFVSNPELEELINYWQLFEQIHSRTYQHIIKSVFPDPARIRNEVANLQEAMDRLDTIVNEFEQLETYGAMYTLSNNLGTEEAYKLTGVNFADPAVKERVITHLIRSVGALYAMESIQFMTSFACTFALANQDVLTGTSDQVKKIAKDEKLHVTFNEKLITILAREPETAGLVKSNMPFLKQVMDETVAAEKKWARYLFSEGRQVIGLNLTLTLEYIDYLATKAYSKVGLTYDNPVLEHPIPWVETYFNPERVQVAPQERDVTNYTLGSVKNDFKTIERDGESVLDYKVDDFLDTNEEECMGAPTGY